MRDLKTIFCAVDFEVSEVLKRHAFVRVGASPFEVWENDTRRIVLSGIGLAPAATAFCWACSKFDFDEALNIGTAGATSAVKCAVPEYDFDEDFDIIRESPVENSGEILFARAYEISSVSSIEPYSDRVFQLSETGRKLASSSRPVQSAKHRQIAAAKGDLVDMEAYAHALAAEAFGKKLSVVKLVSDFSEECNIKANIKLLAKRLAHVKGVFC